MEIKTGKRFHFDNNYWENPKQFDVISLYQIGDLSCRNGYEVGPHIQPCFEITYILSGKGVILQTIYLIPSRKMTLSSACPETGII